MSAQSRCFSISNSHPKWSLCQMRRVLGHFLIPLLSPDQLLPSPLACPLRCLMRKPICFDVSHNNAIISFNLNRWHAPQWLMWVLIFSLSALFYTLCNWFLDPVSVRQTEKHSCRSSVIGMRSYPPQYPRSSAPLNPSSPSFFSPFFFSPHTFFHFSPSFLPSFAIFLFCHCSQLFFLFVCVRLRIYVHAYLAALLLVEKEIRR